MNIVNTMLIMSFLFLAWLKINNSLPASLWSIHSHKHVI